MWFKTNRVLGMQMSEQCATAERKHDEVVAELQQECNTRRRLQHSLSSLIDSAQSTFSSGLHEGAAEADGNASSSSRLARIRVQLEDPDGKRASSSMLSLLLPLEADASLASAQAQERRSLACMVSDLEEAAQAHGDALPALRAARGRLDSHESAAALQDGYAAAKPSGRADHVIATAKLV